MKLRLLVLTFILGFSALQAAQPLPGQLMLDPDYRQSLIRQGGGRVFLCGPGDPENFLYRGERNPDGTRRGDQVELIEKLARHGGNTMYLQVVRTHGGDAKTDLTHNPFLDSDPAKGIDNRILDQWEHWFALMDRNKIVIYFIFYDDGARLWNTGDSVGAAEREFFETIVRRFKHHRNLIWIVGEESEERYTTERVQALGGIIRSADSHGHIIGTHHLSGMTFRAWKKEGVLQHFSMQLTAHEDAVHAGAVEAIAKAEGQYQVIYSENTATPRTVDAMRHFAWEVAMAGAMPLILQINIADTPVEALAQCRILQRFFEASDAHTMVSRNRLGLGATRHVLAAPGRSYIAYARSAGPLGLRDLPAGRGVVTWTDVRSGKSETREFIRSTEDDAKFERPAGIGDECAAWIRFPDGVATARATLAAKHLSTGPTAAAANQPPSGRTEQIRTRRGVPVNVHLRFTDKDGPGPYSYVIIAEPRHGKLTGTDNDRTYTAPPDFVGQDRVVWKVNDGLADSEPVTVILDVRPAPQK